MATSIGTLTVDLRTNTAKFNKGFDTARGKAEKFTRTINKAKVAVVALAGGAGIGLLVKSSLDYIDTLTKTAQKLGLTETALASLRHAAALTGVKTSTFDMALQRMTRRLSEAAQGTGEAVKAIQELGLDAQRLAAMSPDKAFLEISEAMSKLSNQSDVVRLSFKFFDSEGVALANTMKLGASGLNAAAQEAEFFGLAISKVDAKAVEDANDAMLRAKSVAGGLAQEMGIVLAPVIERMAKGTVNLVKAMREFFGLGRGEERLNQLFKERAELVEKLNKERAAGWNLVAKFTQERLDGITEEMNQIIARRDVDLEAYRQRQEAERALMEQNKVAMAARAEDFDSHIQLYRKFQEEQTKVAQAEATKRARIEERIQDQITNMRMAAFQHAANFIRAVAPESKKAAIAALVLEKALAIAQVKISTLAAAQNARRYGDPLTSEANAKRIEGIGALSIGLIAATGLAQAASINSGGGGAATVPTVSDQTPSEQAFDPFNVAQNSGSIQVHVNGVVTQEVMDDVILPTLENAFDRGVVLFTSNSDQALEISR